MVRSLRVSQKIRDEWAIQLRFEIEEAKTARSGYLKRVRESYRQYRNILPPKNRPWPGCSNVQPPLTARAVEQVVRRTVMFTVQGREYIHLAPNSTAMAAKGRAPKVESYLRWQAEAELGYFDFIDQFERQRSIAGSSFAESEWVFDERVDAEATVMGRERLMEDEEGGVSYQATSDTPRRRRPVDKVLDELFGGLSFEILDKGIRQRTKKSNPVQVWSVQYREKGIKKTARVTIDLSEEYGDDIEVVAEFPRVIKDQPRLNVLNVENVIVTPGNHDIQDAPLVAVREFRSADYVKRMLDSGVWYLEGTEEKELFNSIFGDGGVPTNIPPRTSAFAGSPADEIDELNTDDDSYLGSQSTLNLSRKVTVLKVYTDWDIRSNGRMARAQMILLPRYNKIVRVHYQNADNKSGMRNIMSRNFLPVRGQFYGLSLPQFVRSLQIGATTTHNMFVDREDITNNPVMMVDPFALGSFDADYAKYRPGDVIPVPSPHENVMVPQFPSSRGDSLTILQQYYAWSEDMTSIGANSVGRSEDRPNAQRTARGAALLMGQTQAAIEYSAETLRPGIVQSWKQIHSWNVAEMPPGKEFRVMGTDEIVTFNSREDIRGDFDFTFDVGQAVLNDEVRRYLMTEFFQLVAPIANADPRQVKKPMIELCIALGKDRKIPNPERFLPKIEDSLPDPMTPEEEHQFFMMGQPTDVHPEDNVQRHIEEHSQFMESDRLALLPSAGVKYLTEHMEATLRQRDEMQSQAKTAGLGGKFAIGQNPAINAGQGDPAEILPQMAPTVTPPNTGPGVEGNAIG